MAASLTIQPCSRPSLRGQCAWDWKARGHISLVLALLKTVEQVSARPQKPSATVLCFCRPIPLAPSFGPSADALYTPRPTGRGRDPRLIRSLAQVAPASAPGVTQAQPEPAIPEASREPIAEATKHISTEAQDQQETFQREVPEASASEAPQPDSGRTVTDAAAARARAEEQRRQQDQHPSQQSRRSPRTSFLATREAEPAVSSPQHHQSDVRAGHVHLEASGAADPQAHSPARSGVRGQAHVTVPERDHATSTAQRLPCSQASKVPRVACQSSQPELLCMEQLKPDSLSGAAHGSSCDNQQGVKPWDDQPSAPTGNSRGAQLPAQAADASLKSRPVETRAPAAQSGYNNTLWHQSQHPRQNLLYCACNCTIMEV